MYIYFTWTLILMCAKDTLSLLTTDLVHNKTLKGKQQEKCNFIVVAHRGASGYVPEHTLGAYALAVTMGADYIETDLVMTKDGHLVAQHDNYLSMTTDIAQHPEFASRRCNKTIDGTEKEDWFSEDFTLAELKTLRVIERIPKIRPGNAKMDGAFTIPSFAEILDLVKSLELSQKRIIGIYIEIKHSTYFKRINLPMECTVIGTLRKRGYFKFTDPVYIESLEVTNLKELKKNTKLKLVQLYDQKSLQPYDQQVLGTGMTYKAMSSAEGLLEVAKYAAAVGPDKSYIIPRDENNRLGPVTSFVADAHKAGLKVHPYTFRAENYFLPAEYQSEDGYPSAMGDFTSEMKKYVATGIDGVFSDNPDTSVRVRGYC